MSATNDVFIGEQHLRRLAIRQGDLRYQHSALLGIYLGQYKPRTVRNFRKREIAFCVALSPSDHSFQTGIGCLRRVRFAASNDHVPEHFTKVRCRWQQQNAVPCTRRKTISFLSDKGLAAYAIIAGFGVGLMLRIIELRAHRHKGWPRWRHRLLPGRAPSISERQAQHYRTYPDDVFPKRFHLTYSDSAAGIIAASMRAGNLRLTAKRGESGEPCRIRTGDPLLKRQMLYRLS